MLNREKVFSQYLYTTIYTTDNKIHSRQSYTAESTTNKTEHICILITLTGPMIVACQWNTEKELNIRKIKNFAFPNRSGKSDICCRLKLSMIKQYNTQIVWRS